ncbi:unnamed protein product [Lactuca virosa]|uniref:Transposase (putative) gypsy type domain-containing protein n=1 Tax=Lactuca virosa TaxID=75947 RepID=A0AAU9NNR7_9ASTR|nr:unnamed protein product [Lactuca virosa]
MTNQAIDLTATVSQIILAYRVTIASGFCTCYVGVYTIFFRSGLRLPTFDFLNSVQSHYKLHIAQIAPNGFKKIMCFVLLNKSLDIIPSLSVFRHFYVTMVTKVSFSIRHISIEIYDGLPFSIMKWKPEFFFMDASVFGLPVQLEDPPAREHDSAPELTHQERSTVDRLVVNFIKWSDLDDSNLELTGLGDAAYVNDRLPAPCSMAKQKTESLHGKPPTKPPKGSSKRKRGATVLDSETVSGDLYITLASNPSSVSSPKHPHTVRPSKLASPSNTDGNGKGVNPGDSIDNIDRSTPEATIESSGQHECPVHSDSELSTATEATTESILLITPISVVEPIQQVPLTTSTPTTNLAFSIDSLLTVLVPPTSKILPMMSLLKKDFIPVKNQYPPPTLMSLASSLPSFLHPYTSTNFANKHVLSKMTDE